MAGQSDVSAEGFQEEGVLFAGETQEARQSESVVVTSFPLQLSWSQGPNMPVALDGYIHSVEINGTWYIGGGYPNIDNDAHVVMVYNNSSQWQSLPPYDAREFTMTSINNKLVLVGGQVRDESNPNNSGYSYSDELGEWQPDIQQWTYPFPPMSTPRSAPSAIPYKHWLVVAGGAQYTYDTSVEVLDVTHRQWSAGPSTPITWHMMKSATIADTWYLMGGNIYEADHFPDVYSVSLETLVSQSASDRSKIWKKLPSLNCSHSCPLIIGESLLAIGGWDDNVKPVSTIQRYVPETNTWVQAGLLPHAVYDCTCFIKSNKIHVIGGWNGKARLETMFTSSSL